MASAVSAVTRAVPSDPANTTRIPPAEKAPPLSPASPPAQTSALPQDTVTISAAGQTALQESQETRFQTTQEASHGDRQAQRLLTQETTARNI